MEYSSIMYEYKGRVIRVIDADTIDFSIDLGFNVFVNKRVRLSGINAAEKNTDLGKSGFLYVKTLLSLGTHVIIQSEKENSDDKYGRYLGKVFFAESKECLNDILIQKGLAVPYDGKSAKSLHDPSTLAK